MEYEINIDSLCEGTDFSIKILRTKLEYLCKDSFNRYLKLLEIQKINKKE